MKRSIVLLVVLIALLIAVPMPALSVVTFMTGNDLVKDMQEHEKFNAGSLGADAIGDGIYMGYVIAVADAYAQERLICLNDHVKVKQITTVVTNYLKANPDKWDRPAIELVTNALVKAFPCKK